MMSRKQRMIDHFHDIFQVNDSQLSSLNGKVIMIQIEPVTIRRLLLQDDGTGHITTRQLKEVSVCCYHP